MSVKTCSRCDSYGPFNKDRSRKDGLSSYCRECTKKSQADFRANNPEKMRMYDRKSYVAHREERIAKKRAWQKDNRDKVIVWKRAWEARNPGKMRAIRQKKMSKDQERAREIYRTDHSKRIEVLERNREWRKRNPECTRMIGQRKRSRARCARGFASSYQLRQRIALFGGMCAYCATRKYEHLDHVIAISNGGTNWPSNIRPACSTCNLRKGTKTWTTVKF